jgi:hypothetical protein
MHGQKNIKLHFSCSINLFYGKLGLFLNNVEKYGTAGQATDDNIK